MTATYGNDTQRHYPPTSSATPHRMDATHVIPGGRSRPSVPSFGQVGTDIYAAVRAQQVAAATRPDTILLLTVVAMVLLGLIMVQSASQFVNPLDPTAFARRDALWVASGGVVLAVTSQIDYHRWRRLALPGIVTAVGLSGLVLRLGDSVGGAQRWLSLGSSFSFQPSEIAKLAFILFAADHLTHQRSPWSIWRFLPVTLAALALLGLVLLQNDLGTTMILAACAFVVCVMAGVAWWPLVLATGGALGAGTLAIIAAPFRRARILAFLHPLRCDLANSYHICQSLIALGSGGILGRGLGDGLEKSGYLPAPFTDSIYAVIGEELGFWGATLVLIFVALLLWRGLRTARNAPDAFGALLASGITCWLVVQASLNIGSSIAALPFTGVPLPFISFGGSSLVVSLAAVGVLLNISAQNAGRAAKHER